MANELIGAVVRFEYHGTMREGTIEKIGKSVNGQFFTVKLTDGVVKNFSCEKMSKLGEVGVVY